MSILIKRILIIPLLLLVMSFVTFLFTSIIPGDIAEGIIIKHGGQPSPETVAMLHTELGLSQGLFTQYFQWLSKAIQLDLGTSWITQKPVVEEIAQRIVPTLILTGAAILVGIFVTIVLGTVAAYFRNTIIDRVILGFSLIMNCIPEFLLAFILLYVFAYVWNVFPLVGYGSWEHLVMPAFVLGVGMGAGKARILRSSILEVLNLNYIAMARSKGLSNWQVLMKHAMRNALIPIVTSFGASLSFLLGGTVIIENIFNWPGIGRTALQAISSRDIPMLQGYVLFITVIIIVIYLLVDFIYMYIDPRVHSKGGSHRV